MRTTSAGGSTTRSPACAARQNPDTHIYKGRRFSDHAPLTIDYDLVRLARSGKTHAGAGPDRQTHGRDPAARLCLRTAAEPDRLHAAGLARRIAGVDIKTIGIFSLVGLPYIFKLLWAPLFDRYRRRCSDAAAAGSCLTRSRSRSRSRSWAAVRPTKAPFRAGPIALIGRLPLGVPGHRHRRLPGRCDSAAGARAGRRRNGLRLSFGGDVRGHVTLIFADHMGWRVAYGLVALLMALTCSRRCGRRSRTRRAGRRARCRRRSWSRSRVCCSSRAPGDSCCSSCCTSSATPSRLACTAPS